MAGTDFDSVDAYIAAAPEAVREALRCVRGTLRAALPEAEEAISYRIPVLRLHGTHALYFAGYARHYAVYPVTDGLLAALGDELAPYRSGKATLRFPLAQPVPVDLLRRIATCRADEIAAQGGAAQAGAKPAARRRRPPTA